MSNTTSQHILGTAANLLGFCLFVITSLRLGSRAETHLVSEATSIIAVLLTFSCGFSFVSLRTKDPRKERILERIADYFFIASLIGILVVILLITRNFMEK
jgi:amino acid transporter